MSGAGAGGLVDEENLSLSILGPCGDGVNPGVGICSLIGHLCAR